MCFNPDISKQVYEIIFFPQKLYSIQSSFSFYKHTSFSKKFSKHFGMQFDKKLNFEEHLKNVESKVNKTIGIIPKLQNVLPRSALLTTYKSSIRPHLDYGDMIYNKAFSETFHAKLESSQRTTTLAITGAVRGSSAEKIF